MGTEGIPNLKGSCYRKRKGGEGGRQATAKITLDRNPQARDISTPPGQEGKKRKTKTCREKWSGNGAKKK